MFASNAQIGSIDVTCPSFGENGAVSVVLFALQAAKSSGGTLTVQLAGLMRDFS